MTSPTCAKCGGESLVIGPVDGVCERGHITPRSEWSPSTGNGLHDEPSEVVGRLLARDFQQPAPEPVPFPVDVFPPAIAEYVAEGSTALGVPADFIAGPLLAYAGATIGSRLTLTPKPGWSERPIVWTVVVGGPGSGKSPADELARDPVEELQQAAYRRYLADKKLFDDERRAERSGPFAPPPRQAPRLESFFTTDATIEAVAAMLGGSCGVGMAREEIAGWVAAFDAYRKAGDRQNWLSLWAGRSLKVDRKTAETVYVQNPVVCVTGGIQPDRLPDLQGEAAADDGFLDRFLVSWPRTSPQRWTETGISVPVREAARAVFRQLRPERRDPAEVVLADAARWRFIAWFDTNQESAATASGLAAGFAAKLPRHLLRLCLILHALWRADDPTQAVDDGTMEDAIELAEYYRAHHASFANGIGRPGTSRPAGTAGRILRRLNRSCGEWVSRSDLLNALRTVEADELDATLQALREEGRVEMRTERTETKPRQEWRVPPSLLSHPGDDSDFGEFGLSRKSPVAAGFSLHSEDTNRTYAVGGEARVYRGAAR
jgi:hypothetical protein